MGMPRRAGKINHVVYAPAQTAIAAVQQDGRQRFRGVRVQVNVQVQVPRPTYREMQSTWQLSRPGIQRTRGKSVKDKGKLGPESNHDMCSPDGSSRVATVNSGAATERSTTHVRRYTYEVRPNLVHRLLPRHRRPVEPGLQQRITALVMQHEILLLTPHPPTNRTTRHRCCDESGIEIIWRAYITAGEQAQRRRTLIFFSAVSAPRFKLAPPSGFSMMCNSMDRASLEERGHFVCLCT